MCEGASPFEYLPLATVCPCMSSVDSHATTLFCVFVIHTYHIHVIVRTEKGYPLRIEASAVVVEESPVNRDMLIRTIAKLDYPALFQARSDLASASCCQDNETIAESLAEFESGFGCYHQHDNEYY
jgi:hypothetical protein